LGLIGVVVVAWWLYRETMDSVTEVGAVALLSL